MHLYHSGASSNNDHKPLVLALVCVFLLPACGGDGGGDGTSSSGEISFELGLPGPGDVHDYFPLSVGNFWHFQGTAQSGALGVGYQNSMSVTEARNAGGKSSIVLFESNSYADGVPTETYLVHDLNGIAVIGAGPADPLTNELAPYWEARFPLEPGGSFQQLDRRGVDFGEDLDGDGLNETVDIRSHLTAVKISSITVPAGTFADALEIRRNATLTITLSDAREKITASAEEVVWLAPGIGWIRRISNLSLLGETVSTTEELVACIVDGQLIGVTLATNPVLADVGDPSQPKIYAFDVVSGQPLVVALTGQTDNADLIPYLPGSCLEDHTQRPATSPEDCQLVAPGDQLVVAVSSLDSYVLSVFPAPTSAIPSTEGTWEHPIPITQGQVYVGQVETRGISYYAATGLPLGDHNVSITGLSSDADLHVYSDETFSWELDCTLRGTGDILNEPEECTVDGTEVVYFTVRSGELNLDGATYNILVN